MDGCLEAMSFTWLMFGEVGAAPTRAGLTAAAAKIENAMTGLRMSRAGNDAERED